MAIAKLALGQGAIKALIARKDAREAFPFLKNVKTTTVYTCVGCNGAKSAKQVPDYNWVKQKINELSKAKKIQLKQMLNTNLIVMSFYRSDGSRKDVKF